MFTYVFLFHPAAENFTWVNITTVHLLNAKADLFQDTL